MGRSPQMGHPCETGKDKKGYKDGGADPGTMSQGVCCNSFDH